MNIEKRKTLVLGIVISLLLFNLISVDWVKADTVNVTFIGITNPSSTHRISKWNASDETSWDTEGDEISSADYLKANASDDVRFDFGDDVRTVARYHSFNYNVSEAVYASGGSMSTITNIQIIWEGQGYWYNGSGWTYPGYLGLKNQTTSTYITSTGGGITGTFSGTGRDLTLSANIPEANVSDYVGSNGYLRYVVRTPQAGTLENSDLDTDYAYIIITYTPSLTAPTLVSPTNGGTGYTITPNFDWNVSTGGTSPYTYEIMVDTDLAFGSPDINATGISDSNYSYTTGLTPNTTYYWKVRTLDAGSAYSAWTSTYSFTTASFVAPTITSPVNGIEVADTTPTISWSASTGGSCTYTYEVMIDTDSGFASPDVNATGVAVATYTPTTELELIRYYAKVRAKDSLNNYSSWSSVISFTVIASSSGGGGPTGTVVTSDQSTINQSTIVENDTPIVTSSSSTNIFTRYIVQPARTVVINPMQNFFAWVWNSFKSWVRGSSQEKIGLPVIGYVDSGFILLLGAGCIFFLWLFGSPVKKRDVKRINKHIDKNVKKIKKVI